MGSIIDRIIGGKKKDNEALDAIAYLKKVKIPLRIEIENTPFFFYSKIFLRTGAVVVVTPKNLKDAIKDKGNIRVRLPHMEGKELKLEISSGRYGGSGQMSTHVDNITLICKIPGAEIVESRRDNDRLHTSQYRDLTLLLPDFMTAFPIMNMSNTGLKFKTPEEGDWENFPLGKKMEKASIMLGSKAKVELVDVVPRSHYPDAVGLEMSVKPEGASKKILEIFLDTLEKKFVQMYTVKPAREASPA